jgi:DNA replication protein DnaC
MAGQKSEQLALDRTRCLLETLGFVHTPTILNELVERGVREDLSMLGFLDLALASERDAREERRVKNALQTSGLPVGKTLSDFDFAFQAAVEKSKIEMLATCEFVRRKENALFLGPPGVGKTHLAAGLGVKAAQNGFTVAFLSTDRLLEALRKDETVERRRMSRRKHMSASLLVIDELGFQAMDRADAHRFFRVINYRYERASTIITSNKGVREWPEVLAGDEVLATAILDQFLHHCHVAQIDGRSYRLKDLDLQLGGKSKRTKQK